MTASPADSTETIERHTLALADIGRRHDLTAPVRTCGDWTLADLIWHLAQVQDFWTFIVAHRPAGPDTYPAPTRPPDEQLPELLAAQCHRLTGSLAGADPADAAWSWSDDHTIGFTLRRQAHEALVHHVDGLLAADEPLPDVDPVFAADGVDELVTVMLAGVPDWADFIPSTETLHLATTDTHGSWPVRFGRMTGTSPTSGTTYDLDALELIEHRDDLTTTVTGSALDLDLWLWGRRDLGAITVTGEPAGATRLREQVAASTQ